MALTNPGILSQTQQGYGESRKRRTGWDKMKGSFRSTISGGEDLSEDQQRDVDTKKIENADIPSFFGAGAGQDFLDQTNLTKGERNIARPVLEEAQAQNSVNEEISNDRKGTAANVIGTVALTAAVLSNQQGKGKSHMLSKAHAPTGMSQSNLFSGGGLQKYLSPMQNKGRKIKGYF